MLGIATMRQESWRTSVDNTNILEVEVEEAGPHELGCNWWKKKDLPAYKYCGPGNWHVSCRMGREPLHPWLDCQTLGPFPRAF